MEQVKIPDALLGRRVSVRFRVGERAGRPLYRDAVGELSAEGADRVHVHTRRGPVRVDRASVVAVRAVPPAPPRRASLSAVVRLEELCADAWPAPVDRRLGAWRLRLSLSRCRSRRLRPGSSLPMNEGAKKILTADARSLLNRLLGALSGLNDWSEPVLEAEIARLAEAEGLKLGKIAQPLRAALTGSNMSPGIFEVAAILGRDESLRRIREAAEAS